MSCVELLEVTDIKYEFKHSSKKIVFNAKSTHFQYSATEMYAFSI